MPLAILDSEIEAHCRLRRIRLTPQDLDALDRLDAAWLTAMRKAPQQEAPSE